MDLADPDIAKLFEKLGDNYLVDAQEMAEAIDIFLTILDTERAESDS